MIRSFVCVVLGVGTAFAQPKPVFELADVHVSPKTPNPSMRGGVVRGGRYEIRTATMVDLIRTAWNVDAINVTGGPAWLDSDRFDVIAKVPANAKQEEAGPMLQALLIERFGLVVHQDTKPITGYALTFARKSGQMKPAADTENGAGCKPPDQPEKTPEGIGLQAYNCSNVEMPQFAEMLRQMAPGYIRGNPVVDQTGLKGGWDFSLKWVGRGQVADAGGDSMSLFGAIDKLGLKLAVATVPQPVIVVDRVNEKPTPNAAGVTERLPPVKEAFEVAEIRPSAPGTDENFRIQPGGRIDAHGITLKDLIEFAWQVDNDDQVAGPKSIETNRFDIVAKAPGTIAGNSFDQDALAEMLQALLTDRFRIKVHQEERPVTVYALVSVKPKMKAADPSNRTSCKITAAGGTNMSSTVSRTFVCQNITMAQFADKLESIAGGYVDHPVVDRTGISGAFDFPLNFSPARAFRPGAPVNNEAADPNGAISLFEAIDKQLGLKLEKQQHPMPVLVIDHVDEKPTDN
ncbi:MAG TPA: TIGR03435 family protein [Bryobacteraceae bacterium]|nr:TIGR03435 family protein [Bryobacteraceae bacterium]